MRLLATLPVFLGLLGSLGLRPCAGGDADLRKICPTVRREFFYDRGAREWVADFRTRDLEEKYVIYRCGMETMHPPVGYLVAPFAEMGAEAVPFLKEKLSEAERDLTAINIMEIFIMMGITDAYDVSSDEELVGAMCDRIEKMQDDSLKQDAVNLLDKLKTPEGNEEKCAEVPPE